MTATRRAWLVAALVVAVVVLVGSVVAVGAWASAPGPGAAGWSRGPAGVGQPFDRDEWPGTTGSARDRMWERMRSVCPSATVTPTPAGTPEGES